MRTRSIFTTAALIVAGCNVEQRNQSTDTSRGSQAATATVDSARVSPLPAGNIDWIVTFNGIGPVRINMTVDELRRVAVDVPAASASAECSVVRPGTAPRGVSLLLVRGKVARIDIDSAGVRSQAGVAVGDSADRVGKAYPGQVTATSHKYVPGAQYLTVRPGSPADSALRIVFETDSGHVTRFRSGRMPEVEWVERCG